MVTVKLHFVRQVEVVEVKVKVKVVMGKLKVKVKTDLWKENFGNY